MYLWLVLLSSGPQSYFSGVVQEHHSSIVVHVQAKCVCRHRVRARGVRAALKSIRSVRAGVRAIPKNYTGHN